MIDQLAPKDTPWVSDDFQKHVVSSAVLQAAGPKPNILLATAAAPYQYAVDVLVWNAKAWYYLQ